VSITGNTLTLRWSDFVGHVPAHSRMQAYTHTTYDIQTPYSMRVHGGHQSDFHLTQVMIRVTLDRAAMWSRPTAQTAALLKHEQGHYDITALLMRDLDTDLTALLQQGQMFPTRRDLLQAVDNLKQPAVALVNRLQSTSTTDGVYDRQTQHGTVATAQQRWDAALARARTSTATKLVDCLKNQGIALH
jgi:Bacterial protein of unknown function (DUF922)